VEVQCIEIFILFKRVTGWHGLFPSWEGLGVGFFPRFHEDKGREISVNISRSYRLTHPLDPLPRGDFLISTGGICFALLSFVVMP